MTYTYCMRKDTVHDEKENAYTVYGIDAISAAGETLSSFPDLFFDEQKAEHFVRLCNEGGLSLLHFANAVEDAVAAL